MKLESMTQKDLIDLAKTHKIKRRTLMTKEELIKALKPVVKDVKDAKEVKDVKGTTKSVMKRSGVKKVLDKTPVKGYEPVAAPQPKPKVTSTIPDYYVAPHYNQDTLFFLPVSPGEEYAYWEISSDTTNRLKKELEVKECKYELRVHCRNGGQVQQLAQQSVSDRGDYYFGLWAPLKTLWAEIGVWDKNGRFHTLMSSAPILMPSDVVSSNIDAKWITVADSWENIYKLSGVDETKHKGGASMPDHILRRIREFAESSFRGDRR